LAQISIHDWRLSSAFFRVALSANHLASRSFLTYGCEKAIEGSIDSINEKLVDIHVFENDSVLMRQTGLTELV